MEIMKDLEQTDTSTWPKDYVKLFLTNHLLNKTNTEALTNLGSEVFDIRAEDSVQDLETRRCKISISDLEKLSLNETGNLPTNLKIRVGARFMLTSNLNTQDKSINGSIGTVKYLNFNRNYPLKGHIFVEFDDPEAGNSLKDHRLSGELKTYGPTSPIVKPVHYSKSNRMIFSGKQFLGILARAITVRKSQGSTFKYMMGDMNRTSDKITSKGKPHHVNVQPGQFYMMLSRGKSRDIRSWNKHVEHFCSNRFYAEHLKIICFVETHLINRSFHHIGKHLDGWLDVHKDTEHGLDICYNPKEVKVICELDVLCPMEMQPVMVEVCQERIILVVVYRTGPLGNFLNYLIENLNAFPKTQREWL